MYECTVVETRSLSLGEESDSDSEDDHMKWFHENESRQRHGSVASSTEVEVGSPMRDSD